ncbi:MAG: hypothetical protein IKV94_01915 [Clostridia bacterium]|nr:hypothetical protein [Clostridia bacterium]
MKKDHKWIISMFIITFVLALILGGASNTVIEKMNLLFAIVVLVLIVFIGILFDIIGMAVATCEEAPFHAKAARKVKGAKQTLRLLKSKDKTTNFCNDLMGDMCGIISGSAAALISIKISTIMGIDVTITSLLISAIVAAATVGGKALGKKVGINKAEQIMELVGKIVSIFSSDKIKSKNNRA